MRLLESIFQDGRNTKHYMPPKALSGLETCSRDTELNSLELFLCSYSDPEVIEMRV